MGILLSQRLELAIERITEFCKIPRKLASIQEECKNLIDPLWLYHLLWLMVWHQDLSYIKPEELWWAGYPPEAYQQ